MKPVSNLAMARPELRQAVPTSGLSADEMRLRSPAEPRSSRVTVILAFAAVYLIWGSTYLAIRYAIQTLPPFLMAATRFLTAGTIVLIWASFRGDRISRSPTAWRRAFVIGALLLLCGNGGVTWSEKYVASGLTALLVATEPLWVVMLNWRLNRKRPNAKVLMGVLIGLAGVGLLVSGAFKRSNAGPFMSLLGAVVIVASALAWAGGSVYASRSPIKTSTSMAAAMQMLAGGSLLVLVALINGEFKHLNFTNASLVSIGALGYLIVFGSIVAFTAYSWLLQKVATAHVATYAYVNPVVAVFLGWLIASEPLTARMLVSTAVIVGSVVLITTYGSEGETPSAAHDSDLSARELRSLRVASLVGTGDERPEAVETSVAAESEANLQCPTHPCA
jgi:drug/metabolite transporter (DMT)-like permease